MVTKECRVREAREMLRSAEAVSQCADLACEPGSPGVTTEKYQACVREQAIHSARLVSQSAELLRQVARERAYGAKDERMKRMWISISCEAAGLSAHAAVAAGEEQRLERLNKN